MFLGGKNICMSNIISIVIVLVLPFARFNQLDFGGRCQEMQKTRVSSTHQLIISRHSQVKSIGIWM